jgi:hypothetical protein
MFPAFIAPAMGAFAGMVMREAKAQALKYAPDIIDDVFMKGRNTLQRALGTYKTKTYLKKNNKPNRTIKNPQRRPRRRLG